MSRRIKKMEKQRRKGGTRGRKKRNEKEEVMAECGRDDEKEDGNFRHACEREFTLYSLPFILYLFIFLLKNHFLMILTSINTQKF